MKIIATVLANNSEDMVADAVKSVAGIVDQILVVDTGITDSTLNVVGTSICGKILVEPLEWTQDFAAARNFSLDAAARNGATWALTIDTDERLCFPAGFDRCALTKLLQEHSEIKVWQCPCEDLSYQKDRVIRVDMPQPLRWKYRVHECLTGFDLSKRASLPGTVFKEVPKSPAQFQFKLNRDLGILQEELANNVHDSRLWYYLGQTYQELSRPTDAINAFATAASQVNSWKEELAAAAFRGAILAYELGKFAHSRSLCAQTIEKDPSWPEAYWLAGACCLALGDLDAAVVWERLAISIGHVEGLCLGKGRIVHNNLTGWFEGPYQVLHKVFEQIKNSNLHSEMNQMIQLAQAKRLSYVQSFHTNEKH